MIKILSAVCDPTVSSRFNAKLIPKEDISMEVRSRRYGTRTMFDTARNF